MSCNRGSGKHAEYEPSEPTEPQSMIQAQGAKALAVLQTGEYPLWFQLTEDGPVLIDAIEDAAFSAPLVPWPLALHVRFFQQKEDELVVAVNRDGFMLLSPNAGQALQSGAAQGIEMFRFSGGDFWRQYTVGGLVIHNNRPAALLYLDDRFLDSKAPLPRPRTWTFSMESNDPVPLDITAFSSFPAEDGWDVDTLRLGSDGMFYYRTAKRSGSQPSVRMYRTRSLTLAGAQISQDVFFGSAPRSADISHPSLPPLPEGFVYTGIAYAGDSLFASWEEQENFYIGAAGFLVMKPSLFLYQKGEQK